MSYSRQWTEEQGSEDSHGRALWALGTRGRALGRAGEAEPRRRALSRRAPRRRDLHEPARVGFRAPRDRRVPARLPRGQRGRGRRRRRSPVVCSLRHRESSRDDWPWFEDRLTYCNARLPQALLVAGARMGNSEMVTVALRALEWLSTAQQTPEGYFAPVGSNGFHVRDEAEGDLRPAAGRSVRDGLGVPRRAACDGRSDVGRARALRVRLVPRPEPARRVVVRSADRRLPRRSPRRSREQNQGAESTLSFLLALLEMRSADRALMARSKVQPNGVEARAS